MDIEDIQSNLHSLRQLYGLLKKDQDGLPNVTPETLDNKARLLLKSLLDSASERVLKAHSQIVGGQFDGSFEYASAQPQQLKDSTKEELLALPNLFNQSWEKQSGGTERIVKPVNEVGAIETPNLIFSATESENTRKRCRVCKRPKTGKQFKPIGKDHGRPNSIRVATFQDKPNNQSSFASGSNENGVFLNCVSSGIGFVKTQVRHKFSPETTGEIPEEDNNCLSKQVADAIKQIEKNISSLQLEPKSGKNINESPMFSANQAATTTHEQSRYLSRQMGIRNSGPVSKHNVSSRVEEPNNEHEILKGNWLALQDIKTILNKLESAHEPNTSHHDFANQITRDSILKGQNKTVNTHSGLSVINQDQDLVPWKTKTMRQRTWLDSKHGQLTEARKNLYKSVKDLNHFGLSRKDKPTNYPKRRYLQPEPASTSYSSQSSEQHRSTSDSHTEDYSESGRSGYIIGSSSGENEVYSSSLPDSASFPHSGESEASSRAISYSHDASSKTSSPGRVYKSTNVKKTKKQDGRWRKLKDKLGIIFHHHHHHHHHHNNDKKDENTTTKVNHETPLPKRKGKSPNDPPRKHEGHEERQGAQKLSKSVVRDQQRGKNQHGSQFHALVQGLKHTRHLKKSKSTKHGSLPSKNGKHGNKKAVKTSHWWQMLRHHGRLSKPPPLLESSVRNKHT